MKKNSIWKDAPHHMATGKCKLKQKWDTASVQFSLSVMSDSLLPHGLQRARLPCPASTPRACSNSCPLSQWCHPTISSSVIPFFSWLHSLAIWSLVQIFSKSSLNIWKFSVHVLLKPGLENFEHYFASMWVQLYGSLSILWHCLFLGLGWKLTFFNPVATWCKEATHWKRLWCWERLKARGEGDNRGWDGWMASLTQWTWVWVGSGSWWWTGRPGMLWFMGLQRGGHDWVTELNWRVYYKQLYTNKMENLEEMDKF